MQTPRKISHSLGLAFVMAISGCASHKSLTNPDECAQWDETKFRIPFASLIPFLPPTPRFQIPSNLQLNKACIEGFGIATPTRQSQGQVPSTTLTTYYAYNRVRDKISQGDNVEYHQTVLGFADLFMAKSGLSYSDISNRLNPRLNPPLCSGRGIAKTCEHEAIQEPVSAIPVSTKASEPQ